MKRNNTLNNKLLKLIAVVVLGSVVPRLHAQETISVSGKDIEGIGGSISYTVGQIVYQTQSGTDGSIVQGVQQPYEIFEVTSIEKVKNINPSILVYPNPTTNSVTLTMNKFDISNLEYQLSDFSGRLLQYKKITSTKTIIEMSSLVPTIYFVKVIQDNIEIKTFKIIKNN